MTGGLSGCDNLHSVMNASSSPAVAAQTSIVISAVGALISLFAFGLAAFRILDDWRYRSRQESLALFDEYWYRDVVLPVFLEPLLAHFRDLQGELKQLQLDLKEPDFNRRAEICKEFLSHYKAKKEHIVNCALIVESFVSSIYEPISEQLDKADDAVTQFVADQHLGVATQSSKPSNPPERLQGELSSTLRSILDILVGAHARVKHDRQKKK